MAIIAHIDGKFPENILHPQGPRWRARFVETLAWMNTVHPTFTHIFMPDKFTGDAAAQQAIKTHVRAVPHAMGGAGRRWSRRPTPPATTGWAGVHVGLLDTYALTLLRWGTIAGINPEDFPELWAHVQRTAQVPAVARAMEASACS